MAENFPRETTLRRSTLGAHEGGASEDTLEDLRREIEVLRASRARLVLTADADRRSIERDLHDGVQQRLVALAVNLQLVEAMALSDPAGARELLEGMTRDVQLALDDASRLAQRIYPPTFAPGGFPAALRATAASAGIPVEVRVPTGMRHPPEALGTIYRCFVEVLHHADARAVATVSVQHEDGSLAFAIDLERPRSDVELDGLCDRVEALGGRLAIDSAPGRLRIAGSLPISRGD